MTCRSITAGMLLMAGAACHSSPALANDDLRCSIDHAPDRACTISDTVEDGVHYMDFHLDDGRRMTFVGRSQTGWWTGTLNGQPAMGYERNRGNVIFSTFDLQFTFAWWHPDREHGTY